MWNVRFKYRTTLALLIYGVYCLLILPSEAAVPDASEVMRLQQQGLSRSLPGERDKTDVIISNDEKVLEESQNVDVPVDKKSSQSSTEKSSQSSTDKITKESTDSQNKILVKGFKFTGLETVPELLLQNFLSDYLGKSLSLQELHAVAAELEKYLRESEYLMIALAYLPAQIIKDGIVLLGVYEGKLTELGFKTNRKDGVRLNNEHIRSVLKNSFKSATINSSELELTLGRLNQTPGVNARGIIIPEVMPGRAKINIEIKEGEIFSGEASVDSFGSRVTGTEKANVDVSFNDPFGGGGQLKFKYSGSQFTHYGNLQASMPFTGMGIRIGAQASYSTYELCCEFASLQNHGNSVIYGVFASYLIDKTVISELTLRSNFDLRANDSYSSSVITSAKKSYLLNTSLQGTLKNKLLNGGQLQWSLSLAYGNLNLQLPSERASDQAAYRTAGKFSKSSYTFTYSQWFSNTLNLNFNSFGQYAFKNLDSGEKFSLGGYSAVRAYPNGEASGDSGFIYSLELRDKLNSQINYGFFYDYGRIHLWKNPVGSSLNQYSLSGVGTYFELLPARNITLRAVGAKKIGKNEGQRANGTDADGRNLPWQIWLQGAYQF